MTSPIRHFPPEIEALPAFEGPFDAHRLQAEGCEVLFATYPAGTSIAPHTHPTDNVGVITRGRLFLTVGAHISVHDPGDWYHVPAGAEHAARFDVDSAEIEFWFRT
jgi:quercetin dioxygenase-like cupin family protein